MKLNTIIIGGFLVVSLIPFIFIGYFAINTQIITQISEGLNHESQEIFLIKDSIDSFLQNAESDILFLSNIHELKYLINSKDEFEKERLKQNVRQDFLAFSKEKNIYSQIRYINENGFEVVRIDSNRDGPKIIPDNQLQNKNKRYYFEDTMSANLGTVYISPLDLNIEEGELENRGTNDNPIYVPVIRYATPVFDDLNNPKGIVITNIYADSFLKNIYEEDEGEIIALVNNEGFYLVHQNKSKEWGFMLNKNETLQEDYGENILPETIYHLEELIFKTNLDFFIGREGVSVKEIPDNFILHSHIWPSGNESLSGTGSNKAYGESIGKIQGYDYYWTLVIILEKDKLLYPIIKIRNRALLIGFFIMIIITFSSVFLARNITKPLEKLRDYANYIGKGNLNTEIKIKSKNEIGELALTLEKMRINLKKSRSQLVEKKKLEIANMNLKKTSDALTKSNKLKDFFIDIMNHDLLNPIGIIRLNSEMILDEEKDIKKKNIISRIYRNSDRTIKMIQNAYALSRLQSGKKLIFEKKDVGEVLKKAIEDVKDRASGKGMKILEDIRGNFPTIINPLIYNVFYNIITNAVKYAPEKSQINVSIKESNSFWRIQISDRGEGVPDKYKKAIFERFTRLEKGAIKGSGLGLAITKKIAEVHKGKVWVENNPQGGSIFIVEIPKIVTKEAKVK